MSQEPPLRGGAGALDALGRVRAGRGSTSPLDGRSTALGPPPGAGRPGEGPPGAPPLRRAAIDPGHRGCRHGDSIDDRVPIADPGHLLHRVSGLHPLRRRRAPARAARVAPAEVRHPPHRPDRGDGQPSAPRRPAQPEGPLLERARRLRERGPEGRRRPSARCRRHGHMAPHWLDGDARPGAPPPARYPTSGRDRGGDARRSGLAGSSAPAARHAVWIGRGRVSRRSPPGGRPEGGRRPLDADGCPGRSLPARRDRARLCHAGGDRTNRRVVQRAHLRRHGQCCGSRRRRRACGELRGSWPHRGGPGAPGPGGRAAATDGGEHHRLHGRRTPARALAPRCTTAARRHRRPVPRALPVGAVPVVCRGRSQCAAGPERADRRTARRACPAPPCPGASGRERGADPDPGRPADHCPGGGAPADRPRAARRRQSKAQRALDCPGDTGAQRHHRAQPT